MDDQNALSAFLGGSLESPSLASTLPIPCFPAPATGNLPSNSSFNNIAIILRTFTSVAFVIAIACGLDMTSPSPRDIILDGQVVVAHAESNVYLFAFTLCECVCVHVCVCMCVYVCKCGILKKMAESDLMTHTHRSPRRVLKGKSPGLRFRARASKRTICHSRRGCTEWSLRTGKGV